jgi:hypothetical protein
MHESRFESGRIDAGNAHAPGRTSTAGPADHPAPPRPPAPPAVPATLKDAGLPADAVEQLLLKVLYTGEAAGTALAERLYLPFALLDPILQHVRAERLVEVRGTAGVGTASYRYALTDLGRERARQYLDICQYVGPAPVPLAQYVAYMRCDAAARPLVDRDRLAAAFSHLVVSSALLDQLGPAVNAGKSIFLYGPPGNGKTVLAEGVGRALGGELYVPHAIDVDGQLITLYDPVTHQAVEADRGPSLVMAEGHDRRWAKIRRPVVVVGGELTLEMLDLSFNPIAKFYEAPIQLKANGGVFVVDDFGRQRVPARDLLNRWIVPLESRIDYLTLHTGRKFEVPFDVLIVFATNLQPAHLADEAFLRRIPYKIYAKGPTVEEYTRIFELNCRRYQIPFNPRVVDYLLRRYYRPRGFELRACHPRDLVEQVVNLCRYRHRPPALTRELVDLACRTYFLEEASVQPSPPAAGQNGTPA